MTTESFFTLYGLRKPGEDLIRYIGITSQPLSSRLRQHLTEAGSVEKKYWVDKMLPDIPEIVPLALELTLAEAYDLESQVIVGLKKLGFDLLNRTNGGGPVIVTQRAKERKERAEAIEKQKRELCQAFSEVSRMLVELQARDSRALHKVCQACLTVTE